MRFTSVFAGALVTLACSPVLRGQSSASPEQVHLQPAAPLSAGIESFPRVVAGGPISAAVAAKINAALQKLNTRVAAAGLDCRTQLHKNQPGESAAEAWKREVHATMDGPRFLSLLASDSYYCGGPYPNDGVILPLVFDLSTGRTVNWLTLLPSGPEAKLETAAEGSQIGVVVWSRLQTMAASQAQGDCKDVFKDGQPVAFALWLDARQHAVVAQPVSFPHVVAACASPVVIPADEAARMGFSKDLVSALRTANPGR